MVKSKRIDVSVIIVHYHVKKELIACLESITSSMPRTSYEIIVVDNDDRKTIYKDLKNKFADIIYITNKNKGYGEGNNAGAKYARGEYLFFLNPDTKFINNCIDTIINKFSIRVKKEKIFTPCVFCSCIITLSVTFILVCNINN